VIWGIDVLVCCAHGRKFKKYIVVRQSAHLFWSALRAEILQNRFKIKQNLGLYAGRHTDVGALRAEIIQN